MKWIKLFAVVACMVCSLTAAAQEVEYTFRPHAYLTLQGGAQYTLGEAAFGDLISPNVQFGVGYQIIPWFGFRVVANAWQSRGGFSGVYGSTGAETVQYKWAYVAPGVDFMFNMSNAVCGWNPKRVFNLSLFIGAGANIAWHNNDAINLTTRDNNVYKLEYLWDGTHTLPYGRAGINFDFRLCDALSIGIETNATMLSDKYNSKKAGSLDWYFNVLAGFRINLGKTYRKKEIPTPVIVEEVAPIVEPVPTPEPVVELEPATVVIEPLTQNVFFTIGKTIVRDSEIAKVKEVAEYLKQYPDANVTVTGYADKGTGTAKINARLAEQRATRVADILHDEYNISPDRITINSKGDTEQPFEENDMNRVTICVAE